MVPMFFGKNSNKSCTLWGADRTEQKCQRFHCGIASGKDKKRKQIRAGNACSLPGRADPWERKEKKQQDWAERASAHSSKCGSDDVLIHKNSKASLSLQTFPGRSDPCWAEVGPGIPIICSPWLGDAQEELASLFQEEEDVDGANNGNQSLRAAFEAPMPFPFFLFIFMM